jgi:hypothetical protein
MNAIENGLFMDEQFNEKLKSLETISRVAWVVLVFVFGLGVWAARLEFQARAADASIEAHSKALSEVHVETYNAALWRERTEANRYTIQEAKKDFSLFQELMASQDKRLQRVEDTSASILRSLDRLESNAGTKP